MFDGSGGDSCPACRRLDAEDFERIRKYLREHEGATAEEVSAATDVSLQRILGYLREGRLIERINASYPCDMCGAVIHSGRLCDACRQALGHEVHQVAVDLAASLKDNASLRSHYYTRRLPDERS